MAGCIFCSRAPLTNEHIFRQDWLNDVLPGDATFTHQRERDGRTFDPWRTSQADLKVKCVCGYCNSRWMNRLDHDAEAVFLNAAVRGERVTLADAADWELVARWALKIAVMFDQTQKRPIVDQSIHHLLYTDRLVPSGVIVWLASTVPPDNRAYGHPHSLAIGAPDKPNAYLATFGVQHFVAQVFVPSPELPQLAFERGQNADIIRQLWPPPRIEPFVWPPPRYIFWDSMRDFAGSFVST
jgi:hypothetical protein